MVISDTIRPEVWLGRRAFTLVELLLVIVLVALLAALLLPALAAGRRRAQACACLSNLRQWGLAQQLFATDNHDALPRDGMGANGRYPGNIFQGDRTGHPTDPHAWFNRLPTAVGQPSLASYWTAVAPGTANFSINAQHLPFPGGRGKIWHCPGARLKAADGVAQGGRYGFFSYVMNIDLKKRTASVNFPYPDMPRLAGLLRPAATVLMFEAGFNPRTEVVNQAPEYNSVNPANRWRSFAVRHQEGGHVAFVDGHARRFGIRGVTNAAGANEPRNPDLIWNPPYREQNP